MPLSYSNRLILIYSIASCILLYFAYSQAVNLHYYADDALRYTFGGLNKSCALDDGFYFMLTLGRPLQAYIDCLTFKAAYSFENLRWVRIISVMMLGCCMGLYANLLFSFRFPIIGAFLAGAGLLLLPHFYEFITMPATSLPSSFLLILQA